MNKVTILPNQSHLPKGCVYDWFLETDFINKALLAKSYYIALLVNS